MSDFARLAGLLTVRPLSMQLPPPTYDGWRPSPFTAKWGETVSLLRKEVEHLRPRQTILEADFRERDLRIDGMPRANATAQSPGVILTLVGTPYGDLRYPCSTFRTWDGNLRAIALALEALRKVDRYGVTRRGEQYAGWKALPSGADEDPADLRERGAQLAREHDGSVRSALRATHPDTRDPSDGYTDRDYRAVVAYKEALAHA